MIEIKFCKEEIELICDNNPQLKHALRESAKMHMFEERDLIEVIFQVNYLDQADGPHLSRTVFKHYGPCYRQITESFNTDVTALWRPYISKIVEADNYRQGFKKVDQTREKESNMQIMFNENEMDEICSRNDSIKKTLEETLETAGIKNFDSILFVINANNLTLNSCTINFYNHSTNRTHIKAFEGTVWVANWNKHVETLVDIWKYKQSQEKPTDLIGMSPLPSDFSSDHFKEDLERYFQENKEAFKLMSSTKRQQFLQSIMELQHKCNIEISNKGNDINYSNSRMSALWREMEDMRQKWGKMIGHEINDVNKEQLLYMWDHYLFRRRERNCECDVKMNDKKKLEKLKNSADDLASFYSLFSTLKFVK